MVDNRKKAAQIWEDARRFLGKLALVALLGWLLLGWVCGVAVMEGEGMYPRLRDGDMMVYYRLQKTYHLGDVVTFTRDGKRYTGRVAAQGADLVDLGENGEWILNESAQSEEIFYPTLPAQGGIAFPCRIPQDSVFLLCDFRTNATDSRSYGPVRIKELDGKVITILRRRGI